MRDVLGPGTDLGYCTNVHAGVSLRQTRENLQRYATAVKTRVSPPRPMWLGLWLSAAVAEQLEVVGAAEAFGRWLEERGLYMFTLNGFPYGDFHRPRVGTRVYRPHWADRRRLDHTLRLARVLARLLPEGDSAGSISTLPVAWSPAFCGPASADPRGSRRQAKMKAAAEHLMELVHGLARIELDTGKLIHVDLEPEPGCVLQRSADVVDFFERYLWTGPDERSVRAYLGVCHDVCHAAVMFEEQTEALSRYRRAGLRIGKVQVSSALRIDWGGLDMADREAVMDRLRGFDEPKYLHQTTVRGADGRCRSYRDLPVALAEALPDGRPPRMGEWRVHFHVPLFAEQVGGLATTRDEISRCLAVVNEDVDGETACRHFEVETYAWDRLPAGAVEGDLAEGLARELAWVVEAAAESGRCQSGGER